MFMVKVYMVMNKSKYSRKKIYGWNIDRLGRVFKFFFIWSYIGCVFFVVENYSDVCGVFMFGKFV